MPRYMIQETVTAQAVAAILQNPEDRTEEVRRVFEAVGGSLEQYYISFAEMTVFLIVDVPDQASLSAVMLTFFARAPLAAIRATPIITASEAVDVFKRAASVAFRPPGG